MSKASRQPPPRKPVKARGALPAPRVSPNRVHLEWHQRLGVRILAGILIVFLAGLGYNLYTNKQERDDQLKSDIRVVKQFEKKSKSLRSPMEAVFTSINQAPQEFKDGKLAPDAFKEQTQTWLTEFQKLDAGLRARKVPPRLSALTEARALLVDGTVVYIDAIKQFQMAGSLTDPALRDEAIKQGYNLFSHATSVFGKGQRLIEREKIRLGITKEDPASPNPLLQPPTLVDLEAPPPPPPPPAPPEGGPPGGGPPGVIPVPPPGG
ncbi:MAG: hypothetical protein ABIS18_07325 [Actinomycetota bacterium]